MELRYRAAMIMLGCILLFGCAGKNKIERKTVSDLYNEALRDTSARPPTIMPGTSALRDSGLARELAMAESGVFPNGTLTQPIAPRSSFATEQGVILAGALVPKASTIQLASPQRLSEGTLNEVFDQTDVREAIQVIATAGNQSVIVDDTVGGVTSGQIQNATFDVALQKILTPLGLYYSLQGDTYYVAPADPDSPLFSKIAKRYHYEPVNREVEGLINLLPARHRRFVNSSKERNLILIDAPSEIGDEIMLRLREMDSPVAQVELEAIVCVVSPDSGFRFGLDWNHVVGVSGVDQLKAGMTGLTFSGSTSQQGVRNAFSDFAVTSAFVRLLAQEGYITIRAAPRVTAKDGEKANISIHRETFFSLQSSAANAFFSPTIQKVESGISLEITPRVHGNMISVLIGKAEVSEDIRSSDARPELTSNPYPIINRRQVSTNVNVPDGHTIVIGGLVQRQTVERVNRIPVLSKIPLAGALFQTIEKQEQDAEVAIFISPKLVIENSPCGDASSPVPSYNHSPEPLAP